jgi:hypothetical protein
MTSAAAPGSILREPELAGQTVVLIGGSGASGSRRLDAPAPRGPTSFSPAAIQTGLSKRRTTLMHNAPRRSTPTTERH